MNIVRVLPALAALVLGTPGAGHGAWLQGLSDKLLKGPPYYAGRPAARDTAPLAHLPVAYQRGASQEPIFDPSDAPGTAVARMLADMNAYLDSLGVTAPLAPVSRGKAPDVRFGCDADPLGDCLVGEGALGRGDILMRLAVDRPSRDWTTIARSRLDSAGAAGVLVITLEVAQYRVRQKGLRGDKLVDLGTGHTASLPWLTSLETPVAALILTGALIAPDGRVVRIGAEGIAARRTRLVVSAVGGQELVSDEDVEGARTERRADLPGSPLAWQVALRNLVGGLTGRASPAR